MLITDKEKSIEDYSTVYFKPAIGQAFKSWWVYFMTMGVAAYLAGFPLGWSTVLFIIAAKVMTHSADLMFGVKRHLPVKIGDK